MGIQCFRLVKDIHYTLRLEIMITNYQLWHKTIFTVDKATTKGLTIGNVYVKNSLTDLLVVILIMYYYGVMVNFQKTAATPLYQLHVLADIPQVGNDLQTYAQNFTENCFVAYGIIRTVSDVDGDKTYDFHKHLI